MSHLLHYRQSPSELLRANDLLRLLPSGRGTVLDIGARDGYFSRLLADRYESVTALDLVRPAFEIPRVVPVAGDVTRLEFADNSFDTVFCAEVLEHIPNVEEACRELARVARYEVVIGVPFRQDTRVDRTTCRSCNRTNPPWGHVNAFDEERLFALFPTLEVAAKSFVGTNKAATNSISTALMDWAGNPWGSYAQDEPCVHCGAKLVAPGPNRSPLSRLCSASAVALNRLQLSLFVETHANWIHVVFHKPAGEAPHPPSQQVSKSLGRV